MIDSSYVVTTAIIFSAVAFFQVLLPFDSNTLDCSSEVMHNSQQATLRLLQVLLFCLSWS